MISFHHGVTVGKVRVFTTPSNLREILGGNKSADEADYATMMEDFVGKYPATKNRRWWSYPPYKSNVADLHPDPDSHLIGFYLYTDPDEIPLFKIPTGIDSKAYAEETGDLTFRDARTASPPRMQRGSQEAAGGGGGGGGGGGAAGAVAGSDDKRARPSSAVPTVPVPTHHLGPGQRRVRPATATLSGGQQPGDQRMTRPATARARFSDVSPSPASRGQPPQQQKQLVASPPRSAIKQRPASAVAAHNTSTSSHNNNNNNNKNTSPRGTARGASQQPQQAVRPATAPTKPRPRSAPSIRSGSRLRGDGTPSSPSGGGGPARVVPRSAMARTFWESIQTATAMSANSINPSSTLNFQLHPGVASYKWSSATAQRRILQQRSESLVAAKRPNLAPSMLAAATRPMSGMRPRSAASPAADRAPISTTSATERKQFAVDVYASPFQASGQGIGQKASNVDPASTMLDFQRMLVQSELQPAEAKKAKTPMMDTLVGLPVPGAPISSGSLTLDKMAVKESRSRRSGGGRSKGGESPRPSEPAQSPDSGKTPEHKNPPPHPAAPGTSIPSQAPKRPQSARPSSASGAQQHSSSSGQDENLPSAAPNAAAETSIGEDEMIDL